MMYFISGCKGTETVLQRSVIHITEVLQCKLKIGNYKLKNDSTAQ